MVEQTMGPSTVEERAFYHRRTVEDIIGDLCDADLCGTDVMVSSARLCTTVGRVLWLRATAVLAGADA